MQGFPKKCKLFQGCLQSKKTGRNCLREINQTGSVFKDTRQILRHDIVGLFPGETGQNLLLRDPASSFNFEILPSTRLTCTQTENLISNFVSYLNINRKLRKVSNQKDTAQNKKGSQDNEEGKENLEGIYTFYKCFHKTLTRQKIT